MRLLYNYLPNKHHYDTQSCKAANYDIWNGYSASAAHDWNEHQHYTVKKPDGQHIRNHLTEQMYRHEGTLVL